MVRANETNAVTGTEVCSGNAGDASGCIRPVTFSSGLIDRGFFFFFCGCLSHFILEIVGHDTGRSEGWARRVPVLIAVRSSSYLTTAIDAKVVSDVC
jgi:hypothetical protein